MEEQNNNKRVLSIELDNDVKKVSITGTNDDEKVLMRQELSEYDLDQATGGMGGAVLDRWIGDGCYRYTSPCTRNS